MLELMRFVLLLLQCIDVIGENFPEFSVVFRFLFFTAFFLAPVSPLFVSPPTKYDVDSLSSKEKGFILCSPVDERM
jgi:hypothetical protein